MKKVTLSLLSMALIAGLTLLVTSCGEDPVPPTIQVFSSVDGYQVAFTATATNATSYEWDFGDGETSAEQNPIHEYAQSGTYTATCTVTGEGGTADASVEVTISASELEMLTGGPEMTSGKTWVLSSIAGEGDGIYKADADFTFEDPLPDGIIGLIGAPDEYQDGYTFVHDLSYVHDPVNDSVVSDVVYAMVNQLPMRPTAEDVVVVTPHTALPATFTYTEDTDLTLEVTSDEDNTNSWEVTWSGVNVLEIAGGEFIGIQDFTRKYIVFSIAVDKMQLGIFISATDGPKLNFPSHMLKMTFVPKP